MKEIYYASFIKSEHVSTNNMNFRSSFKFSILFSYINI